MKHFQILVGTLLLATVYSSPINPPTVLIQEAIQNDDMKMDNSTTVVFEEDSQTETSANDDMDITTTELPDTDEEAEIVAANEPQTTELPCSADNKCESSDMEAKALDDDMKMTTDVIENDIDKETQDESDDKEETTTSSPNDMNMSQ